MNPINQSADFIQIQRKPFSRYVHRQDSDNFERMKLAYEKVRNFNEKPIQKQITNIRLRRLFRHIKETFTNSKSRRGTSPRLKSDSTLKLQIRREELAKARKLGVYYCQQNFDVPLHLLNVRERQKSLEESPRKRLERRLIYGNMKSQKNRNETNRSKRLEESITPCSLSYRTISMQDTCLSTKKHLQILQQTMPRDTFIKILISCLSADKPDPEVMMAFEDSIQSKSDLFRDLVKSIEHSQLYIKRYGKFLENVSKIASKIGQEEIPQKPRLELDPFVETFDSKTNFKPRRSCSPEMFIRSYRYIGDDEFLPPPSESVLRIPEPQVDHDDMTLQQDKLITNDPTSSLTLKKSLSHLSVKLEETLRTQTTIGRTVQQKFGDIIGDTVRKGSVPLLVNLEEAIRH